MTTHIWTFGSTGEAYDATQCDERIKNGDVLWVPSEGVVAIADTWPIALTEKHGQLYTATNPIDYVSHMQGVELTPYDLPEIERGYDIESCREFA